MTAHFHGTLQCNLNRLITRLYYSFDILAVTHLYTKITIQSPSCNLPHSPVLFNHKMSHSSKVVMMLWILTAFLPNCGTYPLITMCLCEKENQETQWAQSSSGLGHGCLANEGEFPHRSCLFYHRVCLHSDLKLFGHVNNNLGACFCKAQWDLLFTFRAICLITGPRLFQV